MIKLRLILTETNLKTVFRIDLTMFANNNIYSIESSVVLIAFYVFLIKQNIKNVNRGKYLDKITTNNEFLAAHQENLFVAFKNIITGFNPFIPLEFPFKNLSSGKLIFRHEINNFIILKMPWNFNDRQVSKEENQLINLIPIFIIKIILNKYNTLSIYFNNMILYNRRYYN
jgi:hypothetical protein